jgi:hypothetical protein
MSFLAIDVLAGCATIMSGTTEQIRFESNPPGARVSIHDRTYLTPAAVELSRQTNHQVQFKADGYLSAQREISRDVNPWVWANILIGGIPGLIVDSATGAYNDLTPDVVAVDLVPDPNHTAHQKDAESAVKDTREIK